MLISNDRLWRASDSREATLREKYVALSGDMLNKTVYRLLLCRAATSWRVVWSRLMVKRSQLGSDERAASVKIVIARAIQSVRNAPGEKFCGRVRCQLRTGADDHECSERLRSCLCREIAGQVDGGAEKRRSFEGGGRGDADKLGGYLAFDVRKNTSRGD